MRAVMSLTDRTRAARLALVALLIAAVAGCGSDSDSDDDESSTTRSTTQQADKGARGGAARTRLALNQMVSECTRRRGTDSAGPVTKKFEESVETVLKQRERAPSRKIEVGKASDEPVTPAHILQRIRATLRRPVPEGCGANRTPDSTEELVKRIDRAFE